MGFDTSITVVSFAMGIFNILINGATVAALIFIALQMKQQTDIMRDSKARRQNSE